MQRTRDLHCASSPSPGAVIERWLRLKVTVAFRFTGWAPMSMAPQREAVVRLTFPSSLVGGYEGNVATTSHEWSLHRRPSWGDLCLYLITDSGPVLGGGCIA